MNAAFRMIWAPGLHSLCSQKPGNNDFRTDGFFEKADALLDATVKLTASGRDVWFGVHPLTDRPASGRGTVADIASVSVLVADLDWDHPTHKTTGLPTEQEIRDRLKLMVLQPRVNIGSGHGLQAYWPLDGSVPPEEGAALQEALDDMLADHGLDNDRGDIASILRVPGTFNFKGDPVEVVVEHHNPRPISLEAIRRVLGDHQSAGTRKKSLTSGTTDRGLDAVLAKLRASGRDQDAEALEVICTHHGGHGAFMKGDDVHVTRPEKKAGTSATVGFSAPGVVKMFSANWKPFKQHARYVVNDAGDALELADGDLEFHPPHGNTTETTDSTPASDDEPPRSWAEAHVAEMLAGSLRGRYIWSRKLGWLRWDGRRWKVDENERVLEDIRRWIIQLGRSIMAKASTDDMKAVASYKQAGRIASLATLARRMDGISVEPEQLDGDVGLLNVRNGIVDLRTGELRDHDPTLYMTKLAGADYRPDAVHADIDTALSAIEPGPRAWTQRFLGHAATGEAAEDIVAIWDGGGGNGKTTVLMGARAALGDYATPIARELIMRTTREEHPTAYAELYRVRLAYIEELPEDGVLRVEVLKALSGGGTVRARYMHKDAWSFELSHSLLIATNHRPRVLTLEDAVWRRLRLVPFPHRYTGAGDDTRNGDKTKDLGLRDRVRRGTEQREAMLAWIVAGAIQWYAEGIGHDAEIASTTNEWKMTEDTIGGFLVDRTLPAVGERLSAKDLYSTFRQWSVDQGNQPPSQKVFGGRFMEHAAVVEHKISKVSTGQGISYVGLRLRGELEAMHSWTTNPTPPESAAKPLVDEPSEPCEPLGVNRSRDLSRERFTNNGSHPSHDARCDVCEGPADAGRLCFDGSCKGSMF